MSEHSSEGKELVTTWSLGSDRYADDEQSHNKVLNDIEAKWQYAANDNFFHGLSLLSRLATKYPETKYDEGCVDSDNIFDFALSVEDVYKLAPAEWLVEDVLNARHVVGLGGDAFTGKTTFLASMITEVQETGYFAGKKASKQGFKVVWLTEEGSTIKSHFDRVGMPKEADVQVIQRTRVREWGFPKLVDSLIKYGGKNIDLLIIDTLARWVDTWDVNDYASTNHNVGNYLDTLRDELDTTVVFLHHTTKEADDSSNVPNTRRFHG